MAAKFCRLPIVVQPRRLFADPTGETIPDSEYPLQYGSVLVHWADAPRAAGWFKEAWRLLNDAERIEKLNAPVNTTDKNANNRQATEQFGYVIEVLRALSHGYNLLNIAWHNDPLARELYRRFVSGGPKVSGSSAAAVFDKGLDYNPDWYTKDEFLPRAQNLVNTTLLQAVALDQTGAKSGDRFAPSAMLVLASMDPLPSNGPVALSKRVFNAPYLANMRLQSCPVGPIYKGLMVDFTGAIDFPWSKRCESGSNGFGTWPKAIMPDGTALPDEFDDWRAAYKGSLYKSDPVFNQGDDGIVAPLIEYLPWLRVWAKKLIDRSPVQIIQDARAYTAWQNLRTIQANGDALQQIAGLGDTISQQQHAPDAGWEAAAGGLAIAGTVASAAGGVGAIIGLVAGATAAVIKVTDAVVVKGTKGIGRDDLGRYKPQIERAWLSGDPSTGLASAGAPALPDSELQDPPGLGTDWSPQDCPAAPIKSGSGSESDEDSVTQSLSNWWRGLPTPAKWAFGGVAAAAGVGLLSSLAPRQPIVVASGARGARDSRGRFLPG
jgi:hypothetical protein